MRFPRIRVLRLRGVLRLNGRELLFREARLVLRVIILLFDCGGEEK
jgi:hypothetical protein